MTKGSETFEFQAEARQLLDLMVHSIYTNKDIFLRELISNSSDALDRRRFQALSTPDILPAGTELEIRIDADPDARTLTVRDTGIGMTRDEVIGLIGTIAKSGTREFLDVLKASKDDALGPELIGQFGVGFYSCFMAADAVTLVTRHASGGAGVRWASSGEGTYTVEEAEVAEPGTSVTLHLKPVDSEDGLHDYTSEWQIREIVKKYSDFVAYPIRMEIERKEVERDEEGNPKEGAEEKTVRTLETLNSMKAIWLRDKDEVEADEYNEFYKHISHDWNEPLETIRAKIEGTLEYQVLLFIPSKRPFDLFLHEGRHGLQLYVKRVFIMDDCKELLPEYLRFVRGVVDSEDLSLNISREILQQNRQIQRMRKGLVSKVLDTLASMRDRDDDTYRAFWREFGRVLKEGAYQDSDNRDTLLDLLLFESTADPETPVSLREYVDRMKEGQDAIYYMTGESREAVEASPHLEAFREKGCEVLILTDPVDEVWTQSVFEYGGKRFQSAGKGAVELGTEEERKQAEEARKERQEAFASLMDRLKEHLDEYVKEVRLSSRLTESAACLVGDVHDMGPQLEALLKAANQDVPKTKRILELNPNHRILERLQAIYDADQEDPRLNDYAQLLYGQAVLAEGGQPPNPGRFARLVTDIMIEAL
ncbi:MAG: molecular chaperone HtpG [Candidatus Hydrogenedentes bacterium]|nr:molecular chaperone HtpG [Candidatus Hydrogenedentota bacterium]